MHLRRVAGVGAAALMAAGCGHSQGAPIPRAQASDIVARLQEAQRRANAHACHDLRGDTIPALRSQVAALPQTVDSNVRATLSDGVSHLNDLVQQQCSTPTQTSTTPTTTQTTPTLPTSTVPTQTATTPTSTTTTPRTNTTTTPHTTTTTTPHTTTTPGGVTPPGKGPGAQGPPGQAKKGKGGD